MPKEPKYIVAYPPVDFSRPFSSLTPREIDFYFHYSNRIGGATCKAACAHCYFRTRPTFEIPIERAVRIAQSLRHQGYNIGLTPADSFTDEVLGTDVDGSAFRLATIGMSAWSSGMPLYLAGWERRLDRAWQVGFRSIIISAHESAGTFVPFHGVTKAPVIEGAIANIQAWNRRRPIDERFSIATTFTIRQDNNQLALIRQMVRWAVERGLELVRFNCYANFINDPRYAVYEMSRDDIVRFFGHLAQLQVEFQDTPTRLGISEDWGDAGIEQLLPYLPPEWHGPRVGWCRAGYRLFAIVEVDGQVVVTGCVDKWDPIMGTVVEVTPTDFRIDWDVDRIEILRQAVLSGEVYACWGGVGYERPISAAFATDPAAERRIFG